jgi:hypothetical protein
MPLARFRIAPTLWPQVERAGDGLAQQRDDRAARGTRRGPAGTSGRTWLVYLALVAFIAASVVVGALSMAHDAARGGRAYDLGWPLFWAVTSGIAVIVLLPLVRRGVQRMRGGTAWWPRLGVVLALVVGFPVLHILGMVVLRKLGTAVIGATYDFHWAAELPYEFRKDLITIAWLAAAFWLTDRTAPDRLMTPLPAVVVAPPPRELWLRDGTTSLRVDPGDIVWVASAGNYVEFALTSGKRHLIRGTLAAEATRLAPFGFARVHRTRLVNLGRVRTLASRASGDFDLGLDTGEVVVGSRRYRDTVVAARGDGTARP